MEKSIIDESSITIDEAINEILIMENEYYTYKTIRKNLMKERKKIGGFFQRKNKDGKIIEGFKKECVKAFLETYMRKNVALEFLNLKHPSIDYAIRKYGFTVVKLGSSLENTFLLKSDVENYKNNISIQNMETFRRNIKDRFKKKLSVDGNYTSRQVREMMKLSEKAFRACMNEGTLVPSDNHGVTPLFNSEYIKERIEYQHNLYREFNEKYYTYSKTDELFVEQIPYDTRNKLTKIEIPQILKGMFNKQDKLIMYLKEDVDREVEKRRIRKAKRDISFDDPIQGFYYQVEKVYRIEFNQNVQNTRSYWFQFVEQKIKKSEKNDYNTKLFVNLLVRCTELLSLAIDKEVYSYTSNQLNLLLLNHDLPYAYRSEYYQFLFKLNEKLEELNIQSYNVLNLLNPYKKFNSNILDVDDVIYDVNDFFELIEYCSKTSIHKSKAISDVERFLDTLDSYKYDSMWLYVIMHLNNGWRHDTVITQVPRIDLSNTRVDGLNWLKYNDLTFEEAKDIVYQIGRKVMNVHKTKVEGNFILSDKLTIPFATAMCINELRTQIVNPSSTKLIEFGLENQRVSERTHNYFFKDFLGGDFKFSSQKMNRTYLSVVHKLLEANYEPVKASQFARSHETVETTNIYIKFSREQIDELTSQLFSRDNFGFINQIFTELIFEKEYDREIETNMMIAVDNSIGDKYKIEATSGFINNLVTERQEVERMIRSMTFDEVLKTYRLLMMNELPSKQKHYQCLFSKENCRIPELNECKDCPFSIPNAYAMINLLEKYISQIIRLQNDFDSISIGQRKKLANQFYLTRLQLKEAEDTFGADIVYGFIDGGRERIRQIASSNENLKTLKEYVTLK